MAFAGHLGKMRFPNLNPGESHEAISRQASYDRGERDKQHQRGAAFEKEPATKFRSGAAARGACEKQAKNQSGSTGDGQIRGVPKVR